MKLYRSIWTSALVLGLFSLAGNSLANPKVVVRTLTFEVEGKGRIVIELYEKEAPKAVDRISKLASEGFYNQQRFHRVVKTPRPFLVQIGDPNSKNGDLTSSKMGQYQSGTKIPYENSGYKAVRGAVGLSRLENNKDTGDTQFFILLDNYNFLDGQYTIFGRVTSGMDVVDKIEVGDRITKSSASKD